MAVELEQTIMREIGLGQHYSWFNGSGSCLYIARDAVNRLREAMATHDLALSDEWEAHCRKAILVDTFDRGQYALTNTWIACSYAIQDGIYRSHGDDGFSPTENWHFWDSEKRRRWEKRQQWAMGWLKT